MTVKELIVYLLEFPSDHKVVLSRDSEGNGFSMLAAFGQALINDNEQVQNLDLTNKEDWEEDDLDKLPYPGDDCVILWPT